MRVDRDADRQAVRFALLILLFALAAGLAVYAVDGMLLAPALPAAALVGLGVVVLAHRRPRTAAPLAAPAVGSGLPPGVDRRDRRCGRPRPTCVDSAAAWKRTWWERGVTVPELGRVVACDRRRRAP